MTFYKVYLDNGLVFETKTLEPVNEDEMVVGALGNCWRCDERDGAFTYYPRSRTLKIEKLKDSCRYEYITYVATST